MLLFSLLQASEEAAEALNEVAAEVAPDASFSLLGLATKGGWLMIVLAILSVVAIYVFAERLYAINHAAKIDKNFIKDITDYLQDGKKKSAQALCKKSDSPVARMIEKGIDRMGRPLEDIRASVENVGNVEIARLEKGLPVLASIAGGAPMIGFLGTVMGMVQAFFNMSQAGNNIDITLLSGGIYTAMITTVGGLIVGIIAYFGYNFLTSRVSDVVYKMENSTIEFMDALESKNNDSITID
ncbi:MAG: MotA/TolQ/ExbB proton channel family protein [Bacteroidales bacterium]|nr:MotA/TolQ/ExbB proton channel family protein [Candidatus Equibacterium intestinale]